MSIKNVVLDRVISVVKFEDVGGSQYLRDVKWNQDDKIFKVSGVTENRFKLSQYFQGVPLVGAKLEALSLTAKRPAGVITSVYAETPKLDTLDQCKDEVEKHIDARMMNPTPEHEPSPVPHYYNKTLHGVLVDVNRIAQLYDLGNGPRYHMTKKLLRGSAKNGITDLVLISTLRGLLNRWEQMINEDLQFASKNEPSTNSD